MTLYFKELHGAHVYDFSTSTGMDTRHATAPYIAAAPYMPFLYMGHACVWSYDASLPLLNRRKRDRSLRQRCF